MFLSLSSMYLLVSKDLNEKPEKLAAESTLHPRGGVRLGELARDKTVSANHGTEAATD